MRLAAGQARHLHVINIFVTKLMTKDAACEQGVLCWHGGGVTLCPHYSLPTGNQRQRDILTNPSLASH